MGLRTISQHLPGEPDYALANGRMFQMVRAALERTGVRLMDIELARVADGVDVMSYEKEFALGAELGAKYAIASVWSADRDFSRVQFEKMCDLADKYGMKLNLEFVPFSNIPGLTEALAWMDLMDRPNVQVLVDTLHAHRVKVTPEQLREVAAERFGFVHLCDGPAFIPPVDHPDMVGVARGGRLYVGEGGIDLAGMLKNIPDPPTIPSSCPTRRRWRSGASWSTPGAAWRPPKPSSRRTRSEEKEARDLLIPGLFGVWSVLTSGQAAAAELGGRGEQHVGGGVQCRLAGVLDDADDEADAHHLHGDVVGNAEQAARHGNQQQGAPATPEEPQAAMEATTLSRKAVGKSTEMPRVLAAARGEDRDGDGGPSHVDGGSQGDGDGVLLLVQAQLLAQPQVDRDISGGAAGEEGHDAALLQAAEHQGIGVAPDAQEDQNGVDDQGHEEHTARQDAEQAAVVHEGGEAGLRYRGEHQTQDAEGGAADDPADGGGEGVRQIAQHLLGAVGGVPQGDAEDHSPQQHPDIVGLPP